MTPAGDDASAGSVRGDLSNRPTVVLPGQRGGAAAKRPSSSSRAPMLVVVAANVVWAALVSLLPVLVTVGGITLAASQRPEAGSTLRYALGAWLLAHGVPLRLGGYPLTLIPLAISILAFWRVVVAGRNSVRATHSPASLVAISFAIGYALIGVAAAGLADDRFVSVSAVRAAVTLALFGGWARSPALTPGAGWLGALGAACRGTLPRGYVREPSRRCCFSPPARSPPAYRSPPLETQRRGCCTTTTPVSAARPGWC